MQSEDKTLEQLSAFSKVKMSFQTQQEIWDNLEKEFDHIKPQRTKRYSSFLSTAAAAVAAIAIITGGVYLSLNQGVTSEAHRPGVSVASNRTTVKMANLPSKPVSSTDKSTIKLMKQETHIKAILPSFLPKGYSGRYQVLVQNSSSHQSVYFLYANTSQNQFFKVLEFPFQSNKKSTDGNQTGTSNGLKTVTIDGTQVFDFGGIQYRFVKDGLLFQVISSHNSLDDTMKFLKSLIAGGTPWK